MTLAVDFGASWDLMPATEAAEIAQNVRCLLLTTKGTVFNYRAFGLDARLIDSPVNEVQQRFMQEVARVINRYEPRAKFKRLEWRASQAIDGRLEPVIMIEV